MSIKKYLIETDHLNEKSKKKDLPNFQYRHPFLLGSQNQAQSTLICSAQQSGKTTLMLNIIKNLCHKKKSQIWWVSSVCDLDFKIKENLKDYYVQFFDTKDIENDLFQEMHNYLKAVCSDLKKIKNHSYLKFVLVIDDVFIPQNKMKQLQFLLKVYRHYANSFAVFQLYQDWVQQQNLGRNLCNVWILMRNIPMQRHKEHIFKNLRCDIDFDTYFKIYKDATNDPQNPYNFLVINNKEQKTSFQQGWDKLYQIEEQQF